MKPRRLLPVWLMGLANLPFGGTGAIALITVPQLLAAKGMAEPEIASITALALVPTFSGFLLSPMLDVRFSRRSYAVVFAILSVLLAFGALVSLDNVPLLTTFLFLGLLASVLFTAALGGWLGSLVPAEAEATLGAWFAVSNIAGFGITAYGAIFLLRTLPFVIGAVLLCATILAPILMFAWLPAPGPDRKLAKESFGQFFADLAALVRRPAVLRTLFLFCPPAAAFALTNILGGVGKDFGASEALVAFIAGAGVTIAGVVGALAVPPLTRRLPPRWVYLGIGTVGALFTLGLTLLPRTPLVFAAAMIGQNVFQAAAFSSQNTIIFGEMGKNNPLASTQFAFLLAASALPVTYMQWVDGRGYAAGGIGGSFLIDAGLGLLACAILSLFGWRWSRTEAR